MGRLVALVYAVIGQFATAVKYALAERRMVRELHVDGFPGKPTRRRTGARAKNPGAPDALRVPGALDAV